MLNIGQIWHFDLFGFIIRGFIIRGFIISRGFSDFLYTSRGNFFSVIIGMVKIFLSYQL